MTQDRRLRKNDPLNDKGGSGGYYVGWAQANGVNSANPPAGGFPWDKKTSPMPDYVRSKPHELCYFVFYHRFKEYREATNRLNADFQWSGTPQGHKFWLTATAEISSGKDRWDIEDIYLELLGIKRTLTSEFNKERVEEFLVAHNLRKFEEAADLLEVAFPWDKTPPSGETWEVAYGTLKSGQPLHASVLYTIRQMTVEPEKPHFFDHRALPKRIEIANGMTRYDKMGKSK